MAPEAPIGQFCNVGTTASARVGSGLPASQGCRRRPADSRRCTRRWWRPMIPALPARL